MTVDGGMRINASKEMVLASPETPSNLSELNTGNQSERVYKAFGVPAPRFETATPMIVSADPNYAWSARGPILASIERESGTMYTGKVVEVSEVKLGSSFKPAQAVKIQLGSDGAGQQVVLLGPMWYMENQKPVCKVGDTGKVEACRTTIDGRKHWIAKSIDCNDSRVIFLDGSNTPAWARP